MRKLLNYIRNKITDMVINNKNTNNNVKYSPVKSMDEYIKLVDEEFYTANHGFDCVDVAGSESDEELEDNTNYK
ncbi:hypothetical protein YKV022c [Yokapox virus]|uniref:Protein OPG050 n=1 Tax=Yokapox virus TaxID=1076255 RepID=G3EIA0_9POXV|nr:hypothetical protein YKV022c [Yokapox virus]AEN03611.1 unknown protein [Yokapox virus]